MLLGGGVASFFKSGFPAIGYPMTESGEMYHDADIDASVPEDWVECKITLPLAQLSSTTSNQDCKINQEAVARIQAHTHRPHTVTAL